MTLPQNRFAASHVLMVEPVRFRYNVETGASNSFQSPPPSAEEQAVADEAIQEHRVLRDLLVSNGVHVTVVRCDERTPDAPFCNNWFSTHPAVDVPKEGGTLPAPATLVLYPLLAPNRRMERRADLIAMLRTKYPRMVDLSGHEREARFLESTGSLCLDDANRVAYAALSPRTDGALAEDFGAALGYDVVLFNATDAAGVPYYHTNVMLSIGTRWALVCAEAIGDADRDATLAALAAAGRQVVTISRAQVQCFVGNVLELATWDEALGDSTVLLISATARAALEPAQLAALAGCVDSLLVIPVPVIETVGGGSVRCMVAEVFVA